MPRADRRWLLFVERTLLFVALVALGWFVAAHVMSTLYQQSDNRELERARETHSRRSPDVYLPSPARPAPSSLVGRIEVPRLGLAAIVREGDDEDTLSRAVGHIPNTALPGAAGNVALAGHRDTFFRPLKDIRQGDTVVLTTTEGQFTYVVRETRVVSPNDVSVLAQTSDPTLTLVTCHPFHYIGSAPNRFIVRAERQDTAPAPAVLPDPAPSDSPEPAVQPVVAKPRPAVVKASAQKPRAKKPTQKKSKPRGWRVILRLFH